MSPGRGVFLSPGRRATPKPWVAERRQAKPHRGALVRGSQGAPMGLDRSSRLPTQGLPLAAPWAKKDAPAGADENLARARAVLQPRKGRKTPLRAVGCGAVQPDGLGRNSPRATPWVKAADVNLLLYAVFVQALKGRHGWRPCPIAAGNLVCRRHGVPFDGQSA